MKISVTQEDIDAGEPCSGSGCAAALALNRQVPGGPWIVGSFDIYSATDQRRTSPICEVPGEMQDFTMLYDSPRGKRLVHPSEFELPM